MQQPDRRGRAAPADVRALYATAEFTELRRRRGRISWALTVITVSLYVAFFIVVALAPNALGRRVGTFGSVGLLVVVAVFVAAWALVWIYLGVASPALAREQTSVVRRAAGPPTDGGER